MKKVIGSDRIFRDIFVWTMPLIYYPINNQHHWILQHVIREYSVCWRGYYRIRIATNRYWSRFCRPSVPSQPVVSLAQSTYQTVSGCHWSPQTRWPRWRQSWRTGTSTMAWYSVLNSFFPHPSSPKIVDIINYIHFNTQDMIEWYTVSLFSFNWYLTSMNYLILWNATGRRYSLAK